ncbi:MAG: ABC transporter permease subunit [Planctomycetota bacterium]
MRSLVGPVVAVGARELGALFRLPVGWIVIALFACLTGAVLSVASLTTGSPATMRGVFGVSTLLVILIGPAVSMRFLSEERRTGTLEIVLSSPAAEWQIALGKYAAGLVFVACMLSVMLVHAAVLRGVSEPRPDWGPVAAGLLSMLLLGSVCVSLGLLASALTESQTLAFLGTVLSLVGWVLVTNVVPNYVPAWLGDALASASVSRRIDDFARGVIDTGHVAFFVSVSGLFVWLVSIVLGVRRWA